MVVVVGGIQLKVKMIVMTSIVKGVDVVMEMDVIRKLGGAFISEEGWSSEGHDVL